MNSTHSLSGAHLHTYETIFQHPLSHNLNWREVHNLLNHIGEVSEQHNGSIKVTRNGHVLLLHRPRGKDVADADDVMTLRHFLKESEAIPAYTIEKDAHWLLVIDHHRARIFRSEIPGTAPQRILPNEPEGHMHMAHDSAKVSRGKEEPDAHSFFEPVAQALQKADRLIIFGTGTGASSEMNQFIAWLKIHYPNLAGRIVGSLTVDEHHLSNDQLLAKARDFYANPPQSDESDEHKQDEMWKKLI